MINFVSNYLLFQMKQQQVKFNPKSNADFTKELRARVNNYFKENNISKYGNANMVVKTIFMLALYITPYTLVLTNAFENTFAVFLLWVLMGVGMAGIGLSIMHDANHEVYSKNKKINTALGNLINLVGGSAVNWKIQHNVLHHTYTNIHEHDEDLDSGGLMRFSEHQKRHKFHRFQKYYAWFLYGLLTISWSLKKDFIQLKRYKNRDLLKTQSVTYKSAFINLVIVKILYFAHIVAFPIMFANQAWWVTLIFYFVMHYVCGFILSTIFQAAHVVAETSFPIPDNVGNMENNWAVHQLYTTANFAKNNRILSWYVGGLNFQVEHHLFPNICHVHYRKLSAIVKKTAEEFHLPYYSQLSFFGALKSHYQLLAKLGKQE